VKGTKTKQKWKKTLAMMASRSANLSLCVMVVVVVVYIHRATGGGVNAFPEVVRVELGATPDFRLGIAVVVVVYGTLGAVGR